MAVVHVPGKKYANIMVFALSTCGWCARTRKLLEDLGIEYDYEYIDLLHGEEQDNAVKKMSKWNPKLSFPTIVINNERTLIGFDEDGIRRLAK
jgi:glutaredoxin-like protein NrdH